MPSKIGILVSEVFGRRSRGRLVRHYFVTTLVLIGGGLITSGLLEIYFRYQESWQQYGLIQKEIAAATASKIEQFVHETERTIRATTKSRDLVRDGFTDDYKWELRRLLVNAPALTRAVAFDMNGKQRAGAWRVRSDLVEGKQNAPNAESLTNTMANQTYFGAAYFADGTGPFMRIAVPVERYAGTMIGLLEAEVDLKEVSQIISRVRVGKKGTSTSSVDRII